ncbi:MAG: hypothetical protein D6767_00800 [Candidatus Hydrogenedentota bacterium]|nr:MAG: hypothetical protein D6767_00800 [Candidatus Hydrogenedentota bacterium]
MVKQIFFFSIVFPVFAISYPVTPNLPKEPYVEGVSQSNKNITKKKKKKESKHAFFPAEVQLGSGKKLKGRVSLPIQFTFRHKKDGIWFEKTAFTKNIKSIEILTYRKEILSKKNKKITYRFNPDKIQISFRNSIRVTLAPAPNWLWKLPFQNEYGKATLYTIFADSYSRSGWDEVPSKDKNYHTSKGHPLSVVKIVFLKQEKSGVQREANVDSETSQTNSAASR